MALAYLAVLLALPYKLLEPLIYLGIIAIYGPHAALKSLKNKAEEYFE